MLTWIRGWLYAITLLGAFAVAAWWFAQQTTSYMHMESMIQRHPVVAEEVGKVPSIRLPFFGYGLAVTDGRVDPNFGVRVSGSKGEASVHADFVDGAISDAYLITPGGHTIPLVVPR